MSGELNSGVPPNLVLMYHRVADIGVDPWKLGVHPDRFDEQLEYLEVNMEPVALSEIALPSTSGRPRVAITFDDGYLDNFENALPRLARRNMPATVFVIGGSVGESREFWWDELEGLVLSTGTLPEVLKLETSKGAFERRIGQAKQYSLSDQSDDVRIDVWDAAPGTRKHSFFEIWDLLCSLDSDERLGKLDELWIWAGRQRSTRQGYRPMNADELRKAAASPLVEIGAHTISHPRLPALARDAQRHEIIGGADIIERTIGTRPRSFSFPFGQRDSESLATVCEQFDRAVLTRPGLVTASTPLHQLNRIAVEDWSCEDFSSRLDRFLANTSA